MLFWNTPKNPQVRQCVENGIIKSDALTVDTTHIEANCTKKVPERIMKHLAKRIFKGLEADNGAIPEAINTNIPDYTQIEDHKQAKDVLSDEKFILQKGLRSLSDKDARVGNKSLQFSQGADAIISFSKKYAEIFGCLV